MRRSTPGSVLALLPVVLATACGQASAPAGTASTAPSSTGLSLHPVVAVGQATAGPVDPGTGGTAADDDGRLLELGPAVLTGADVATATADARAGSSSVVVEWRPSATPAWESLTGAAACNPPGEVTRRIAFVLDGEVLSSPAVDAAVACGQGIIGGTASLHGDFTPAEAEQLAQRLDPPAG